MVEADEVAVVVGKPSLPQEKAQLLIDLALKKGGKDNVTAVLAQYALPDRDKPS
jgi:serine/threonine protein phosphatase PrpC